VRPSCRSAVCPRATPPQWPFSRSTPRTACRHRGRRRPPPAPAGDLVGEVEPRRLVTQVEHSRVVA
jgi:hypothetical protein